MDFRELNKIKKENKKKPILVIKDRKTVLSALDIQKLLGLTIFPQHFVKWPDWCSITKPSFIKNIVLIFINRVNTVKSNEKYGQQFALMFGEPLKVLSPEAYKYTWDREISTVPRSFLTAHAAAMADLNKSILTPVPRRTWVNDEKTIDKMRIIKSVHEITKEQLPSQTITTTTTIEPVEKRTPKRKADTLFPLPIPGTPDAFDRTLLVLNVEQMKKENVPLPNEFLVDQRKHFKNRSDFVPTKPVYLPVSANSPMYAVDCEMVLTSVGSELARVTMIDEKATVMFDRLVKPPNPVKDYLTKFSGITRDMLALIDTTLEDIQRELAETLPGDAILVGHSIGNDLEAMKVFHPYVIDTSVIYNLKGNRAAKTRLRFLSEHFLGRMIQTGKGGHSSAEDAIATMDLVRLKLSQDLGFGDVTTSWRFPEDYQSPIEAKSARFTALTSDKQNSNIYGNLQENNNTTTTITTNNNQLISSICNDLLTESQYFESHPVFQEHLLKLCSFYKSLGKPIHLFNRLLHDSGITYAYWPICQEENDEEQRQQREEQDREKESVQHIITNSEHRDIFIPIDFNSNDHQTTTTDNVNTTTTTTTNSDEPTTTLAVVNKISKKLSNYIVDLCDSHRLVMIQANCSPEWDKAKCYHKVSKFCTKLYSTLKENSLIGVICKGSDFQKPLSKKRTHANILKSAACNFYITLNSNVVIQTPTSDNGSI
ncbi:putative rnase h (70) [Schistosoma mansoni]|uniref:Putative rnase h (70) n=2 Tax=Schistosoma mansoni TaxID=6183 RepID=A0A3Q0KRI3_SCHMA|nr:putative rnase h (70) [Schistosoma mansoni]|eukprot:XP_018652667.1 putative rnase h (70) [Schistosoma mansoni]